MTVTLRVCVKQIIRPTCYRKIMPTKWKGLCKSLFFSSKTAGENIYNFCLSVFLCSIRFEWIKNDNYVISDRNFPRRGLNCEHVINCTLPETFSIPVSVIQLNSSVILAAESLYRSIPIHWQPNCEPNKFYAFLWPKSLIQPRKKNLKQFFPIN